MVHSAVLLSVLGAVLCACSGESPAGKPAPADSAAQPAKPPPKAQPADEAQPGGQLPGTGDKIRYQGPALRAAFAKQGQDHELRVTVTVPGPGYTLRKDGIEHRGNVAVLLLTLDEPNPEQQGPAPKSGSPTVAFMVPRSELTSSATGYEVTSVRVEVAEVARGVAYLVAPEHLLAAVIPVPR